MLAVAFILFAACLVFGGVFVLLRTAKTPKVPKGFNAREDEDDDSSSW